MAATGESDKSEIPLVDRLVASIPTDVADDRRATIEAFAATYVRRIPEADIPDIPVAQLYAELTDLLGFIDERGLKNSVVRAFHPTLEASGYSTVGTVVQVVVDDMPFLVDSIANVVALSGAGIERHLHPLIGTSRDDSGRSFLLHERGRQQGPRAFSTSELDRVLTDEEVDELVGGINGALRDVSVSVRDFDAMQGAVNEMIGAAKGSVARYGYEDIRESVDFLRWLLDDNFVFLGYKVYDIDDAKGELLIQPRAGTGLGILSRNGPSPAPVPLADLPNYVMDRYFGGDLVVITKTNRRATVHRDARMEYIGVRQTNAEGRTETEYRLIGLFTSKAYMASSSEIPVLRLKLAHILETQDLIEGSHDYKTLVQLFETFPKDDLFAMSVEDLGDTLGHLIDTEESERVRMFVRRDSLNRSVSVLVTVPRDRFNASLRQALQRLFKEAFGGETIDYRLSLGESGDARIHFSVWTEGGPAVDVDLVSLEAQVLALARNWEDRVVEALVEAVGESEANRLAAAVDTIVP